jgi:hypothetical protein
MRLILLGMLVLPVGGCWVYERPLTVERPLTIEPTIGIYSKSEVDAINAEAECKRLARNLVQVSRCEVRR